jgi:hypothetical protein
MLTKTRRRRYLIEASLAILAAQFAVRAFPPSILFAAAAARPRRLRRFSVDQIEWVSWAIVSVAERRWIKATDLAYALGAQWMLRRRGIASCLCLGVTRTHSHTIAHTWVECNEKIVFGRADTAQFVPLARFGE